MADGELGRVLLAIARSAIAARARPAALRRAAACGAAAAGGHLRDAQALRRAARLHRLARSRSARLATTCARMPSRRRSAIRASRRSLPTSSTATSVEVSLLSADRAPRRRRRGGAGRAPSSRVSTASILEFDGRRATFLPQVWEALPDPREFLVALKRKAGWPGDFWSPRVNVFALQRDQVGGARNPR